MYSNGKFLKDKYFYNPIILEIKNLIINIKNLEETYTWNKNRHIIIEYGITDILQRIVDHCNSYYTCFQLELRMVE